MEAQQLTDRRAGRFRSFAALATELLGVDPNQEGPMGIPCPEVPLELLAIEAAHSDLGTDMNGRALRSEIEAWLDAEGIDDAGQRQAYNRFWRAIEAGVADHYNEKRRETDQ